VGHEARPTPKEILPELSLREIPWNPRSWEQSGDSLTPALSRRARGSAVKAAGRPGKQVLSAAMYKG